MDETCSVQMRVCVPTVCGEPTVPACQDLQAAGEMGCTIGQPVSQWVEPLLWSQSATSHVSQTRPVLAHLPPVDECKCVTQKFHFSQQH